MLFGRMQRPRTGFQIFTSNLLLTPSNGKQIQFTHGLAILNHRIKGHKNENMEKENHDKSKEIDLSRIENR